MLVTDLPRLTYRTYGDANCLKQATRKFVDTGRKLQPARKTEYAQWWADTMAVVNTQLGTSVTIPPATGTANVANGATVAITNSAGTAVAGTHTAEVSGTTLTDVKLAATVAPVVNAATVVVHNSAGTVVTGTHTAEVATGALTDVKLAATVAAITTGTVLSVPVTGTYVSHATVTVANGVVTAIVLS